MKEKIKNLKHLKWEVWCILDDIYKYVSKTCIVRFHDGERYKVNITDKH